MKKEEEERKIFDCKLGRSKIAKNTSHRFTREGEREREGEGEQKVRG